MESATIETLAALNRAFYAEHAETFADARPRLHPGVKRVLQQIAPGAHVLEVGCGDGKVGRWLAQHGVGFYLGLDESAEMLVRAEQWTRDWRSESADLQSPISFSQADLRADDWADLLQGRSFNWVLAFAVFHHLPGYETRARVVRRLAAHLAPAGALVMSNWQFTRSERLRRRIRPWAEIGLSESAVEPNDYLLSWERKGEHGLRYVHVLDTAEAQRLAAQAGLRLIDVFSADGVTGDLTEYVTLVKWSSGRLVEWSAGYSTKRLLDYSTT